MSGSALLERLIKALQIQPGIGPKAATRIAYNMLDHRRHDALELGQVLIDAMTNIRTCVSCRNYCDHQLCSICANPKRLEGKQLCIVETPANLDAIERSNSYKGLYFVLHGHLSPIDGIGPKDLGMDTLEKIFASGQVKEIILATSTTVEGEATSLFIAKLAAKYEITNISRIASGVPLGGEIDTVDQRTLASSLTNRMPFTLLPPEDEGSKG